MAKMKPYCSANRTERRKSADVEGTGAGTEGDGTDFVPLLTGRDVSRLLREGDLDGLGDGEESGGAELEDGVPEAPGDTERAEKKK
jgi:hypothetical protein